MEELCRLNAGVFMILNDTREQYNSFPEQEGYVKEMIELADDSGFEYVLSRESIKNEQRFRIIVSTFSYTYKIPLGKRIPKKYFAHSVSSVIQKIYKRSPKFFWPKLLIEKSDLYASNEYIYNKWEYPEHLLAEQSVYFPKGLDISDHYPEPLIRQISDHFFCHGRYDKQIMEKNIGKEVFQIGYPRYDRLILADSSLKSLSEEFHMEDGKPIVSWLPTYVNDKKNILEWISQFKDLTSGYNVLIRPHPKQLERDDGTLLKKLESTGFYIDLSADRDMTEIYSQSDIVCCDYGGTIFSAIYTNAPLLLLNASNHKTTEIKRSRSTDIKIRKKLFNLSAAEAIERGGLESIMADQEFWEKQKTEQKRIRDDFFGGVGIGEGARITANKLITLLQ